MLLCISDIITPAEARQVRDRVLSLKFVDGSATAGVYARTVKRNQQLESSPETQKLQEFVMQALMRSAGIRAVRLSQEHEADHVQPLRARDGVWQPRRQRGDVGPAAGACRMCRSHCF